MKKFSRLFVACFLALATFSHAQSLNIGTSRDAADKSLPKTYDWKILDDATVRRTWVQSDRMITADFDDNQGGCIFMTIDYPRGLAKDKAKETVGALSNSEKLDWKKITSKMKPILGMKDAMYARTSGGNIIAVETKGGKTSRISLYKGAPTSNRLALATFVKRGNSGLGVSAADGVGSYLVQDETRRKATGPAIAANTNQPQRAEAGTTMPDRTAAATAPAAPAAPKTEVQTNKVSDFIATMTIIDWIIAMIGLLTLIVLFALMFRKKPQPTTPIIVTELDSRQNDEEDEDKHDGEKPSKR